MLGTCVNITFNIEENEPERILLYVARSRSRLSCNAGNVY